MKSLSVRYLLILTFLQLGISGCGGGGDSSSAGTPTQPNSVAVVSNGTVTGFGSVHVNGVHYETNSTTFTINGNPGTQSDLRVGHVVTVHGRHDDSGNGVAERIEFDEAVKGPVQSVDAAANRLVVLGQTVLTDGDTSFDDNIQPASLAGLVVGDIVEVSGLQRSDGAVQATRIEKKPAGSIFEITGRASSVDTAIFKFNVNALVVNYSAANVRDFPTGQPQNGDLLEAKGTTVNTAGELVASSVQFKTDTARPGANTEAEIEGLITRFASATDFDVAGKPVTTSATTRYENGTAADLALNVKVEAEGQTNANGVLVATKVQFKRQASARVEAAIDSVDRANNRFVVMGIAVTVNSTTRYEDKSDAHITNFNLANLNVGDYVEVRGAELPAGSNSITANSVERRRLENEVEVRGTVDSVNRPALSILGVAIQTNSATQYEDTDDMPISADAFFAAASGRIVAAKGTFSSGVLTAREVELESP